jgi:phospholipid/cholesterol/gamma-HCH transport system permease protein
MAAPPKDMARDSRSSLAPPPIVEPERRSTLATQFVNLIDQLGEVGLLTARTARALTKRPYEIRAIFYQMESLGVQSTAIVATTSIFIGMVMTIQFAFGLQRFGGIEYIPRVIVLSFLRELGPTLTAIIVGGRIGSGMAAEVGAMNVTEQVDAVRALGADPHKKLVLPRVVASILVMPVLALFSLFLGTVGAILVCSLEYNIPAQFFLRSSLQVVQMSDLFSGLGKTPVFGFIIAIVGCHFGLRTTGGTEGVGRSTTRTVVVVSIAILIADFMLTKLFVAFLPA